MKKYFSRLEMTLWGVSVMLIVASFVIFEGNGILTLCASIIGVTSLIFNAKAILSDRRLWWFSAFYMVSYRLLLHITVK